MFGVGVLVVMVETKQDQKQSGCRAEMRTVSCMPQGAGH